MASQTGPPAKLYLRVKQIKERTGISIATLYRWLNDGKFEAITNDSDTITLIDWESFEKYLATWKKKWPKKKKRDKAT
jgi:predicted site-specific integrase-resolvase